MKKEKITSLDNLMPIFHERLTTGQSIRFSPQGTSMRPMLRQGIDTVVIAPVSGELRKYDLPLYQRANGQYILHRIVEVGETYTCLGDNQFVKETGIQKEQVIAVVTAFYRGERKYEVNDWRYQLYCRLWYHSRHIRYYGQRGINWLRRHFWRS